MHLKVVLRIVGFLLMLFSSTLAVPAIVSSVANDGVLRPFLIAFVVTLISGIICWLPVRNDKQELRFRDGFLIVVLFWTVLASFGALPFVLLEEPDISITEAFFESMSGLTTTGATTLTGIHELPVSILYYRQQLQWLGGMGIIVLAVAVMPMLGVGGMQLYRAETPGPVKNSKLTPRIAETAKALWLIYLGLTIACALGYLIAGMSLFDAIAHSFSTVSIGGFSTHDKSLGYFESVAVSTVAMVFMLIAAMNFALHFVAFRGVKISLPARKSVKEKEKEKELKIPKKSLFVRFRTYFASIDYTKPRFTHYFADSETKVYLTIIAVACVVVISTLIYKGTMETRSDAILHGAFQVISIATTTGFTTTQFSVWPVFLPALLIVLSIIGGCAGSTAGGMKVIRILLLFKQGKREIEKLVHPNAVLSIKLNGKRLDDNVINAVWGFFSLYVFSFMLLALAMVGTGVDIITGFSAVTACLNNLGPGLGFVAENYQSLPPAAKWILAVAMLLGRLEMFTLLVLLTRTYWRS